MKYNVNDKLPIGALALYGVQWFILAIAVVITSVFVAVGTPAEKLFCAVTLKKSCAEIKSLLPAKYVISAEGERILKSERENVERALPLVQMDSRLGWEPSMEYVCDKWHLEWKIRQVTDGALREIAAYRKMLNLHKEN